MHDTLIIALAAIASVPVGLWLRRNLNTLGYRKDDEHHLPEPGPRRWVVWTSVLAFVSLAAAACVSGTPLAYLPMLPLAVAGPWLAAVDFDVLRIPNRVLALTGAATLLAFVGKSVADPRWPMLVVPVTAALVTGAMFAAVHFATSGGIGFGDVKLAALISFAVGSLGVGTVWFGVLAGSVAAVIWAKAWRKDTPIPYGPWLLCGAWIAALASAATSP